MNARRFSSANLLSGALLAAALIFPATPLRAQQQNDSQLQTQAQKAMKGFKGVQIMVQNGVVVLNGSVPNFADKIEADHKARHLHGIQGVQDNIQIATPDIPDDQLQARLSKDVEYARAGYWSQPFNAISVHVNNGTVMLGGYAVDGIDAEAAIQAVANAKGVKDVINRIHIDPLSPMDNGIRMQEYRAIYSFPTLSGFGMDPGKPIRIQVENGHVTLYGIVDNQAEIDAAGIRAKSVPGVFSVANDLQVANQSGKEK